MANRPKSWSMYEPEGVGMCAAEVECPYCRAVSGEPCVRRGGQRTYTHQGREALLAALKRRPDGFNLGARGY